MQLRLWKEPTLPCAFGETGEGWHGRHHCEACNAAVEEAVAFMRAARARGEYDEQGYTPAERQAQRRRLKATVNV
ncbi:MAG TPA: hypothetical protein VGK73_32205 [Polyangiaceae bacterium]